MLKNKVVEVIDKYACYDDGCVKKIADGILDFIAKEDTKPNLGCATTRELIDEIRGRIEVSGELEYRTIDS